MERDGLGAGGSAPSPFWIYRVRFMPARWPIWDWFSALKTEVGTYLTPREAVCHEVQVPFLSVFQFFLLAGSVVPLGMYAQASSNVHTIVSCLQGPRGLKFGPDGPLYVAEAGEGGTNSTVGSCEQVPPPIGPYTGGNSARITRIAADGTRTTMATGFPSTSAGNPTHDTSGVADIAFLDGTLYALLSAGGCSHGNPDVPNAIVKVNLHNGRWTTVADLSRFCGNTPWRIPAQTI